MSFTSKLITWYQANKRDLPFRGTKDPYLIWVSEVILQQTRMDQGLGYYYRFIERFPDIQSLGAAREEEVLHVWQGLGYYTRARNMHAAAREVVNAFGGEFPNTYEKILQLKGIGDYSASSIASLAFDEAQPAVDGNVYRFLARYVGFRDPAGSSVGKKRAREKLGEMMDKDQPGTFNQAMIEFGALVCTPANPACAHCIFAGTCYAHQRNLVMELPVKTKPVKTSHRYFHYLVITCRDVDGTGIVMNKRQEKDIWKNLYDFPLIEATSELGLPQLKETKIWKNTFGEKDPSVFHVSETFKHILSHQVIHATFFHILVDMPPVTFKLVVSPEQIDQVPVPVLISRYLQKYFH